MFWKARHRRGLGFPEPRAHGGAVVKQEMDNEKSKGPHMPILQTEQLMPNQLEIFRRKLETKGRSGPKNIKVHNMRKAS